MELEAEYAGEWALITVLAPLVDFPNLNSQHKACLYPQASAVLCAVWQGRKGGVGRGLEI